MSDSISMVYYYKVARVSRNMQKMVYVYGRKIMRPGGSRVISDQI